MIENGWLLLGSLFLLFLVFEGQKKGYHLFKRHIFYKDKNPKLYLATKIIYLLLACLGALLSFCELNSFW